MMMMMTLMKLVNSGIKFRPGIDKFYQPNSGCAQFQEGGRGYIYIYTYIHIYIYNIYMLFGRFTNSTCWVYLFGSNQCYLAAISAWMLGMYPPSGLLKFPTSTVQTEPQEIHTIHFVVEHQWTSSIKSYPLDACTKLYKLMRDWRRTAEEP